MKKILALFAAITMILSCAGCASDEVTGTAEATKEVTTEVSEKDDKESAEQADAETQQAEENTNAPADSTDTNSNTSENTTDDADTDVEDNNADDTDNTDDTDADTNAANDDLLLTQLTKKIETCDNNVVINMLAEEEGASVTVYMNKLGDKFYMSMNMMDWIVMDVLFDGETSYIIDHEYKCYCPSSDAEMTDVTDEYLNTSADAYIGSGTETVDGVEYTYEDYDLDGSTGRYYFDKDGNIKLIAAIYEGSDPQYIDFTVELADTADESLFSFPADYTEMTEDEYSELLYSDMFGDWSETYEFNWDETYEFDWGETYEIEW